MLSIPEIFDRAESGPYYEEKDFDLKVLLPKVRQLIKDYDIHFNPGEVIPKDESLIKDIADAALILLCDVGTYCVDTGRIIKVTESEVKEALKQAPEKHVLGVSPDEVEFASRNVGDERPVLIFGGTDGGPLSEEYYTKVLYSHAKESAVKMIHTGALISVEGRVVKAGTPLEMLACKYEALWARNAVRMAGRPGMPIVGVMSGVSSEAQASSDFPSGLRPTDPHLLCQLNEMKMNWQRFNLVVHNKKMGNIIDACMVPILGGYTGGPEGTALVGLAETLQAFTLIQGQSYSFAPMHVTTANTSDRACIWVSNVNSMAIKRFGKPEIINYVITASGPCTKIQCYEIVAQVVAHTQSAADGLYCVGGNGGAQLDCYTGMEARISGEIASVAVELNLDAANELAKALIDKYESTVKALKAPPGKKFYECYDLKTVTPTREYIELWNDVKRELEDLGLKF